jgi:hypothetical protein
MNKALVEKLAVQSLVWVDTGLADGREQIFSTQVFAELIVQECIDTVSDCSIEYATRPQIVDEIKQHFGLNGMSTEDKKTLIKELLGVNNE